MVVVTNGCQDKGENGIHFILVVFMLLRSNKQINKPPRIQNSYLGDTSDSTTTRAGHGS